MILWYNAHIHLNMCIVCKLQCRAEARQNDRADCEEIKIYEHKKKYGTRAQEQNVDSMFVVMIVIFRFAAKQVYLSLALLVGDE